MISVTLVPPDAVADLWTTVEPMLHKAVARSNGRYNTEELFHEIIDGDQTLWLALDDVNIIGCATIKVLRYPTGLITLSYEYLAGEDVRKWMHQAQEVMISYAKEFGCTKIEIIGRQGWKPLLEQLGWRQTNVQYELDLKD